METDLSLIEIGGVDDSLLEEFIKDESNNNPHLDTGIIDFSCSPLLRSKRSADRPRIPPAEVFEDKGEREKSCCSSTKDINNKENFNENNLGAPRSTEQLQQIKRRKKGGGYNLRKSLAWDRAFFTEEGVLNPLELSILSGSFSKPSTEFLSGIPEEGRTSLPEDSALNGDGSDLQTVEENLFDGLPEKSLIEDQKVGGGLLPKIESSAREKVAPVPAVSRKVHLAKGVSRSVSQAGVCPRPLGLSSQKRITNTNATTKDSKLPRFSVSKPEYSSLPTNSKIAVLGAKRSNCNQNAPPVNVEKNVGLKGSSNNTRTAPVCTSSSARTSVYRSGKNMADSPSETHLSTTLQPPQASKGTTTGLKVTPDPVRPADIHARTSKAGSNKVAVFQPKNAHFFGGNIPCAQTQPPKPSGLRMPSPSLGYFGQPKASASHGIQPARNTQSSNLRESSIPNPTQLSNSNHIGELKPLHAPAASGRLPKGVNDATTTGAIALSSTMKAPIPSFATTDSRSTLKSSFELKNLQVVEVKAESDPKSSYNQTKSNQQLQCVHEDANEQGGKQAEVRNPAHDEVEQISHKENQMIPMNDNALPVRIRSSENSQKNNFLENVIEAGPKNKESNGSELESSHVPPHKNQILQMNDSTLLVHIRSSEQSPKDNHHENVIAACLKNKESNGSELEGSQVPPPLNSEMQVKGVAGADNMIEHRHVEEVQLESLNSKPYIEYHDLICDTQFGDASDNSDPGASVVHSDCLRVGYDVNRQSGEQTELRKPGPDEVEQIQHKENLRLQMNDSILVEQSRASEESHKDKDLGNITVSPESRESSGSEMESSDVLSLVSSPMQVKEGAAGVDDVTEDSQFGSLENNSSVENADFISDNDQSRASEESRKDNDLGNITVSPESRESSGNEMESSDVLSLVSSPMQVKEGAAGVDDMIKNPQTEDSQFGSLENNSSVENADFISDNDQSRASEESHKDNDLGNITVSPESRESSGSEMESSDVLSLVSSSLQVKEGAAGVDDMIKTPQTEDSQFGSLENNLSDKNADFISDNVQSRASEESHKDNDLGNITVSLESREYSGSDMESSDALSLVSSSMQVKEGAAGVDNMIKNPQTEDSQFGSLENNSSVENADFISDNDRSRASEESHKDNVLGNITVSPESRESSGSEMESSDVLSLVSSSMQVKEGLAGVDDMIKNPQKDDSLFGSLENNSSVENPDFISDTQFDYAINNSNTLSYTRIGDVVDEQLQLRNPCPDQVEHISHNNDRTVQMNANTLRIQCRSSEESQKDNGNTLFVQSRSSEESKKDNDLESVIDVSSESRESSGSESKSSHVLSQRKPAMQLKEGGAGVDNTIKHPHVEDAALKSLNINPSHETNECIYDTLFKHTIDHSDLGTSLGSESSLRLSKDQTTGAVITCGLESICSSAEKLDLSVSTTSNGSIPQGTGEDGLKNNISPKETETNMSQKSKIPDGELQCELENGVLHTKVKAATMPAKRKSLDDSKEDVLALKSQLNAVPFSDEWLAAIEAAGEDILMMKTGAVQNSPPEKSLPEPSPWSPVKRKNNQEIGPFDCTKYTNLPPANPE